ncbi:hypothetical protein SCAR479_13408 [Seiridium cardinale]|uniref:Large ribosomal subunit protein uL30m n=1 Tax=Seiridium cardinale TaxID=138064 RepID=A0ABR2X829_9PEZI
MSFFRITLHRSAIGLPERTRGVLAALGLRKRTQTVFHPVSPQFAGMIMKVKELVRVEEVDTALTPKEMREERRPERGFWLERPAPRPDESISAVEMEALILLAGPYTSSLSSPVSASPHSPYLTPWGDANHNPNASLHQIRAWSLSGDFFAHKRMQIAVPHINLGGPSKGIGTTNW